MQDRTSALAAAFSWIEGVLLGSVAISVAIIAVASVGFLLMSGRIDLRRGATAVAGCFVIFGASSFATILVAGSSRGGDAEAIFVAAPPPPPPAPSNVPPPDPYAGAALPQ